MNPLLLGVGYPAGAAANPLLTVGSVHLCVTPSVIGTLWKDTAGTTPVTTNGDLVARIDDVSGNGRHLTQATEALRGAYVSSWENSLGGIALTTGQYYTVSSPGTVHDISFVGAINVTNDANLKTFFGGGAGAPLYVFGTDEKPNFYELGGLLIMSGNTAAAGVVALYSFSYDEGTASSGAANLVRLNGADDKVAGASGSFSTNITRIGTNEAAAWDFAGSFSDFAIYETNHNAATLGEPESYLTTRFAI